ncbi:hypothetical protein PHMEG_00014013 [Phytophthora megakarya]|uniref:Uncharacterized protein n=1 Tax=Phytophthora megakarya TaxID=4795 RepID=A0A225W6I2_9STRA|nr:hypothetical protein PHMEG_00014013 [Phytophthora megakarya]
MHDSHTVTPRFESRQRRMVQVTEESRPTPNTHHGTARRTDQRYDPQKGSSDENDNLLNVDDLAEEWARQVHELNERQMIKTTPQLEEMAHLPLGNIKARLSYRN